MKYASVFLFPFCWKCIFRLFSLTYTPITTDTVKLHCLLRMHLLVRALGNGQQTVDPRPSYISPGDDDLSLSTSLSSLFLCWEPLQSFLTQQNQTNYKIQQCDSQFLRNTLFLCSPPQSRNNSSILFILHQQNKLYFFTSHANSVRKKGVHFFMFFFFKYIEEARNRKIQGCACHMHPLNDQIQKLCKVQHIVCTSISSIGILFFINDLFSIVVFYRISF